jgi:hypothetical protein
MAHGTFPLAAIQKPPLQPTFPYVAHPVHPEGIAILGVSFHCFLNTRMWANLKFMPCTKIPALHTFNNFHSSTMLEHGGNPPITKRWFNISLVSLV